MVRGTIHDILPPERKRTQREVPFDRVSKAHYKNYSENISPTQTESPPMTPPPPPTHKRPGKIRGRDKFHSFVLMFVGALLLVGFIVVLASAFFSGARIIIHPKTKIATVSAEFMAYKETQAEQLGFEIMSLDRLESKEVQATGSSFVEEKASGVITVFNDYNQNSQKLIRHTRFETSEGLVYKIDESVVVPGQKTEDGKLVPGSVEVTVYSDEPGELYNIGPSIFKLPGLLSDMPRYEKFYAESKASIAGGFIGERPIVEPAVESQARLELKQSLRSTLTSDGLVQKPEGFILFPDAVFVEYESQPTKKLDGKTILTEKATMRALIFKEMEFAKFVAEQTVPGYDGNPVRFSDIALLNFTIADDPETRPWEQSELSFTLSGTGELVWVSDHDKLRNDLLGRSNNKSTINTVLSGYPGVEKAEAIVRPFWKRSFPNDISKIVVELADAKSDNKE